MNEWIFPLKMNRKLFLSVKIKRNGLKDQWMERIERKVAFEARLTSISVNLIFPCWPITFFSYKPGIRFDVAIDFWVFLFTRQTFSSSNLNCAQEEKDFYLTCWNLQEAGLVLYGTGEEFFSPTGSDVPLGTLLRWMMKWEIAVWHCVV